MIVDDDWLKEFLIQEDFKTLPSVISVRNLNLWFGSAHVLKSINLEIKKNRITAIIGPSGCGKTTLIRTFNRMCDLDNARVEGEIIFDGRNIIGDDVDVVELRRRIGMVFQKPNPFPKSIFANVAYGPLIHGVRSRSKLYKIVQESLERAALWDEVKDRLKDNALSLSGGQQQRLCIARSLAVNPEVLLMDEPCSALDPISTAKIEDLMLDLKEYLTIIIVTHNMQQAARVSDYAAFLYLGELIEFGPTSLIFERPRDERTKAYITGRFG
ncbi:MAG: phosphate ABC transporter ATP-binding protein PstB [Candidatus Odinarchaeum yellowstonii]|uniref:Phosphate ABC transporter ATP-binding protein PstB n=1 Tax=Odinarchaeota yellowstonii (strain LCB_4) TaxID=1841599 RepID=A0AAF0D264_ODILC|nr:MAG: phosphate ABC transporter ATP-binding protein PstB [Candidatus Odinarchaeum yellowstonii]